MKTKTVIEIYPENRDYKPFVKTYESEKAAIEDFLKYHAENNTAFDSLSDDEIREKIELQDVAEGYFGSWGRVREVPANEATYERHRDAE